MYIYFVLLIFLINHLFYNSSITSILRSSLDESEFKYLSFSFTLILHI